MYITLEGKYQVKSQEFDSLKETYEERVHSLEHELAELENDLKIE